MKLTQTFKKTAQAYNEGYKFIINKGSSRSSKTFSILQLLYIIAKNSKKKLTIHVVSHSTPHLKDGVISDFEKILFDELEPIDQIRTQNPNVYSISNSIVKFIGFDKPGKALGAARDILFINEANQMDWDIVHQLIIRTKENIFIDYNPVCKFWLEENEIHKRDNAKMIVSTFKDNIENLTESQIEEFYQAKLKHDKEQQSNQEGYWYNWWRVYGLGLEGRLTGTIFQNWELGEYNETLPYIYGIDFGFKDPFTLVKCAHEGKTKRLYLKELVYKSGLDPTSIIKILEANIPDKNSLIIADCADPTMIRGIANAGFNIMGLGKDRIIAGIRQLQDWQMVIDPLSANLINELHNYIWLDKKGEVPIDDHCHCLDPIRYVHKYYSYKNS
jgi:phage terminase large subunit